MMNRKTLSIIGAACGLAATAAVLGARSEGSRTPPPAPPDKPPITFVPPHPPAETCGKDAPARVDADFGPGSMTASLSGTHVLKGSDGEMYLSVDLAAKEADGGERPALNVAIVIDHSGSMAGEKIAKAREASRGLITRLHEGDHASLIQFDDTAQVLVPSIATDEAGKRRLMAAIDSIREAGGTNLYSGLTLGRDQVMRELVDGRVNRVILLSDGNANVGVTDIPTLSQTAGSAAERGLRVTTIGLGLDYNEDLMEALAENGRGNYYYVKDAEALEKVFAGELKAIQATVATKTELRLEPACAGVEILEVYGYTVRREGTAVIIPLADLSGGDKRKIVARLHVPASIEGHVGVVKAQLGWQDVKGGERKTTLASLGVDVTQETAKVEAGVDKDVMTKVTQVEGATAMRRAAEAYERGDRGRAVATVKEAEKKAKMRVESFHLAPAAAAPTVNALSDTGAKMEAKPYSSEAGMDVTKSTKADALKMAH